MKICSVDINGKKYTLALTMGAFFEIADKVGGAENIASIFEHKDLKSAYTETLFVLSALLKGGRDYAALTSGTADAVPTYDELQIICSVGDSLRLRMKCLEAISLGMSREIEVEADRKNAETTQKAP